MLKYLTLYLTLLILAGAMIYTIVRYAPVAMTPLRSSEPQLTPFRQPGVQLTPLEDNE